MQRGVAEGQVGHLVQVELVERGLQIVDLAAELGLEELARGFEHIRRAVDGDHAAVGQAAQQELRQLATATTEIQHRFVAA
jgi:hypothetical protein